MQNFIKIHKKARLFYLLFLFILLSVAQPLKAQSDSLEVLPQSSVDSLIQKRRLPAAQVALYSGLMPGLGQIYNRKYWKLPIVYGLGVTLGYAMYWNNNQHLLYRDSFLAKVEGRSNDPFPSLSQDRVRLIKDRYQRDRDFMIILSILLHGLSILDATVDAHLKNFDISDELSLGLKPYSEMNNPNPHLGLSLSLYFR